MADIPATVESEINLDKGYDASDPEQVTKARKKAGSGHRERLEFVEAMLKLPQGRKYLFKLLEKCSVFGNPLVQGDTHSTYFRLGEQNVGKILLSDIQQFPELFVLMMGENK